MKNTIAKVFTLACTAVILAGCCTDKCEQKEPVDYVNTKIPEKLTSFCSSLNDQRKTCNTEDIAALYNMSFDAHYNLVTIHPWADGNGRMARLLMNHLQFEFGLITTKVKKESKEGYIKALIDTRENNDHGIFRDFMTDMMIANLKHDIDTFICSTEGKEGENHYRHQRKRPSYH